MRAAGCLSHERLRRLEQGTEGTHPAPVHHSSGWALFRPSHASCSPVPGQSSRQYSSEQPRRQDIHIPRYRQFSRLTWIQGRVPSPRTATDLDLNNERLFAYRRSPHLGAPRISRVRARCRHTSLVPRAEHVRGTKWPNAWSRKNNRVGPDTSLGVARLPYPCGPPGPRGLEPATSTPIRVVEPRPGGSRS